MPIKDLTIVLTSKENFVWSSMEEIIPHLEMCWKQAECSSHLVEIINIDKVPLKQIIKKSWHAKNFVITCLNFKMAKIIQLLKGEFNSKARLIFHVHNQATIGLWPLSYLGIIKYFTQNDIFICTSSADKKCLNLVINNPNVAIIPFSLTNLEAQILSARNECNDLYFVGRISPQKNLAPIIEAIHLLKNEGINIVLHLFGEEDHLGSPNMGLENNSYKEQLLNLVAEYNLHLNVHFHGKMNRTELYKNILHTRKIFISTSAHSDENFGMAAFRALLRGEKAILSEWGGHIEFQNSFSEQIEYINIYPKNDNELTSSPAEIKEAIKKIILKDSVTANNIESFTEERISIRYRELLFQLIQPERPIEFTSIFHEIIERRTRFHIHPTKIFDNYNDTLALKFFIAYGLKIT